MMLANDLWSDEWFCSLDQRKKLLYLYLLCTSTKCGIFELNMRKMNFDLTNGTENVQPYTKEEVMSFAGDRIAKVSDNKAIIINYIAYNWCKSNQAIDPIRNPLFKSIIQELATYGMTIADVNAMAKKKIIVKGEEDGTAVGDNRVAPHSDSGQGVMPQTSVTAKDMEELFDAFWSAYIGPRKQDKKKCREKFARILKGSSDPVRMFNTIMSGLDEWKVSDTWMKNDGQYVCAPLVWLNGERWNDHPKKGTGNGTASGSRGSANANYKGSGAKGIF